MQLSYLNQPWHLQDGPEMCSSHISEDRLAHVLKHYYKTKNINIGTPKIITATVLKMQQFVWFDNAVKHLIQKMQLE